MSLPKSRRQCTFKLQRVLSAFPVERLPELLPEELLREVLGKHKCLFGGVFHSAIVTWAFLCQVMRDGKDATCQAAVARISNLWLKARGLSPVLHFRPPVRELGGFRMQLVSEMHLVRDRFYGKVKETQLTQAAIDCLALVAYQPGITRDELEKQWNQPAANMLSLLVRKGLLKVEKSTDDTGPTSQYFTTDRFLEIIELESLHDLPLSEELN